METRLTGTTTALITPLEPGGEIDWGAMRRNLKFQVEQGVTGVLPMGTTGGSPTVDWREHERMITRTIHWVDDKVFVLAGVGSNNTKEAMEAAIAAAQDGAKSVLLLDAYYNKPASIQLRTRHHQPVAEAVYKANPECLVVIYIIPGRTNCQLDPIDLAILARECPNVRAVKDASGSIENMRRTRGMVDALLPSTEHFKILSGDDSLTAEMMEADGVAGDGVISVWSNVVPAAIVEMVEAFLARDIEKGREINKTLEPLFKLVGVNVETTRKGYEQLGTVVDKYPNPCPVQTAIAGLGMMDAGIMRPPMGFMSPEAVQIVRGALLKVWKANPEILMPIQNHYDVDIAKRLRDAKVWDALATKA